MAKSDMLHIRVEPDIKASVEATLSQLGLSTTEAVNIFLRQILIMRGLPFDVRLPRYNSETEAAMQEARDIAAGKITAKTYDNVTALIEDLNSDDED